MKDSRSPHGERGLKCQGSAGRYGSHRRSPHGERGLKYDVDVVRGVRISRSPHGERGLKSESTVRAFHGNRSLSSRRAWIEILAGFAWSRGWAVALLTESVD